MNWLKLNYFLGICLVAQPSPELTEVTKIKQYVSHVAATKGLEISQVVHRQSTQKPAFNYPIIEGGGAVFSAHSTDFPSGAMLYQAAGKLVKIKEVINASSGFVVNQYFLQNDKLVFAEAKEIRCSFWKQSPKIIYTEKDYYFHGKYFFVGDSCIHVEERGESLYGVGQCPIPARMPTKPRAYFYNWQAARYMQLLRKEAP